MTKDPVQTNNESSHRVFHGGSCYNFTDPLVVSNRSGDGPGGRSNNLGFRPVRNVKEKE
jgi:formylglycine-generating enzyme required for sulfatase activity